MKVAATGLGELDVASMKKYIQYCKAKCSPRLSQEAGEVLTSSYVKIRDDTRKNGLSQLHTGGKEKDAQSVIPITVRQLEALVRISESLAKMRIDSVVQSEDVSEALRLFKVSTMAASSVDQNPGSAGGIVPAHTMYNSNNGDGGGDDIHRTESFLRSRLTIGSMFNKLKLIEEGVSQGFNAMLIAKCISVMTGRGEILERNQGRLLKRIK
jgi:DNA replication licensing factor MCM5